MHVRQQIVAAVMSACTGLALTGSRVYYAPAHALTTLPALSAVWEEEVVEDICGSASGAPIEQRSLRVIVTAKAKSTVNVGAVLDDVAADIETAVLASTAVRALVMLIEYAGANPTYSGELEQPTGEVAVAFRVLYQVAAGSPETVIP